MNWKVPFSGRSHKYTEEEEAVVLDAMRNADPLTQGRYRDEFEKAFAQYLRVEEGSCFALCNATAGLELAGQLAEDYSEELGGEIIIPAHTFTSTAYPFIASGFQVVWADIDPVSHVVTAETIERCITSRTKAVVVVHLYGYMADMNSINQMLGPTTNGILVIEDAAQALGTRRVGGTGLTHWDQYAGTTGDLSVFSLHSHKNITTLGEGGILYTGRTLWQEVIPQMRHNGHASYPERIDYWNPAMGDVVMPKGYRRWLWPHNFCLGEVECALGTKMLERIDLLNQGKRDRALMFIDELKGLPLKFHRVDGPEHNYHLLVAEFDGTVERRDNFMRRMAYEFGIQCVVQYQPLNRYSLYRDLGFGIADVPITDNFYDHMCSFPFTSSLSDSQIAYMIDSVKEVLG